MPLDDVKKLIDKQIPKECSHCINAYGLLCAKRDVFGYGGKSVYED